MRQVLDRADEFDVIHSHLEWASLLLARVSPTPVVSTFHGRLDLPWATDAFRRSAQRARRHQREPGCHPPGRAVDRHPQRPDADRRPVRAASHGRALLRRPGRAREGDRRGHRDRPEDRAAAEDRGEDRSQPAGARLLHRRLPARAQGRRPRRRVPRRARPGRSRPACSPRATRRSCPGPGRSRSVSSPSRRWPAGRRSSPVGSAGCPEIIRDGVDGFFGDDVDQLAFKIAGVDELDREAIRGPSSSDSRPAG